MRWAFLVLLLAIAALLGIDVVLRTASYPDGWKSIDVVTATLAALGVTLAATTIFLGVAAFLGYFHIREIANDTAKSVAKEAAEKVAKATAEEIAGRLVRTALDQEGGQGGGDEYAHGAARDGG
ncbi:hypothetical protein LGR54_04385 [Ancylobacter sp. Lp-2]|uniref:hypothetical protein n=1 Tax=Ancylobacter sp. Lp-2 TaxID=2881339 RepID=UPI001E53A053|nr:hypothetical protein [Ancylobacter sp. Lp-2]MCB4767832.1 hypothetical protein [Ancylobacter sp. Lp-2]